MAAAPSRSRPTRRVKPTAPHCCGWRLKLILYQVEQGIARITLNRPEKRNALNPELIKVVKRAVQDSDRLILLSGAGSDFCSGADLSGLHNMAEANVLDHMASAREMADLFIAMRRHPHPIIAAVRGRALAGG